MGMFQDFGVNTDLESDGVVADYGSFRVTIARAGGSNKQYLKVSEKLWAPYRRAIELKLLKGDVADEVLQNIFAKTIIRNWERRVETVNEETGEKVVSYVKGIEAEDGSTISFNEENVRATIGNKSLRGLWDDIIRTAHSDVLFKSVITVDDLKN